MRRFLVPLCVLAALALSPAAHAATATCPDTAPVAVAGYATSTTISCTLTGTAAGALSSEISLAPLHGRVVNGTAYGTFTYTPDAGFKGTEDIGISIRLGSVELASPHLHVSVTPNTPPACPAASAFRAVAGQAQRFSLTCTDFEPAVSRSFACCTYEIAQQPYYGTASISNRVLTYTSTRDDQPLDALQVRVTDLGGGVTTYPVTVGIDLPGRGSPSARDTFLLSKSLSGEFPDGPSRNAAISHDQRIARLIAYETDADDVVAGDTNAQTDVVLVRRAKPWGTDGTPWTPGDPEIVSKGLGGAPANARSYGPAVDGDAHHVPHCVAFVSDASNLVPGDTNGVADAFVRDVNSGALTRVSVGRSGRQLRYPATGVSIDGRCERVAFVSAARAWVRDMRTATTFRASGSRRATDAQISRNGRYLAFSTGANVYRAAVDTGRLILVSRTAEGGPGNGVSTNPSITDMGTYVAYETRATNLVSADSASRSDVIRTRVGRRLTHRWISKGGNGESANPAISGAGEFVLFDSDADNFKQSSSSRDTNKARDVFLWNQPTGNISRESRTPDNGPIFGPSEHPATSSRGNYVAFESPSLLVDTALLDQFSPGWSTDFTKRSALVAQGQSDDTRQVYLRYLGPK